MWSFKDVLLKIQNHTLFVKSIRCVNSTSQKGISIKTKFTWSSL